MQETQDEGHSSFTYLNLGTILMNCLFLIDINDSSFLFLLISCFLKSEEKKSSNFLFKLVIIFEPCLLPSYYYRILHLTWLCHCELNYSPHQKYDRKAFKVCKFNQLYIQCSHPLTQPLLNWVTFCVYTLPTLTKSWFTVQFIRTSIPTTCKMCVLNICKLQGIEIELRIMANFHDLSHTAGQSHTSL